jgi:hypothetical protein
MLLTDDCGKRLSQNSAFLLEVWWPRWWGEPVQKEGEHCSELLHFTPCPAA